MIQQLPQQMMDTKMGKQGQTPDISSILGANAFMTLLKNDRHNRIELHLRGEFTGPEQNTQEMSELYQLSELYPTLHIYVNSVGGRVDTLTELVNAIKKFDVVVTICNGQASSAGFMIWCTGDIRVVDELSEMMFHREGWGMGGKTDQILDRAEFAKRHFERIMAEWCGDVVTEEEMEKARTTEVWISGHELIGREKAISWEQFYARDTAPVEMMVVSAVNGKYYLNLGGGDQCVPIDLQVLSENPVSLSETIYLSDPDAEMEEEVQKVQEEGVNYLKYLLHKLDDKECKDELRGILRDAYGKGNFQVKKDNTVRVKVDGEWKDLLDLLNQS